MKRAYSIVVRACSWITSHAGVLIAGLAMVSIASAPHAAWGQSGWPNYPNNTAISVTSGGNVGIGTTAPAASLDVGGFNDNGALRTVFGRQAEGNSTGAGTFLGVRAWATQWPPYNGKMFSIENSFYGQLNSSIDFYRGSGTQGGFIAFSTYNGTERVRIDPAGNVGIGTTTPQYKLAVNGTIGAKDVIVTNTGWPDYVFRPGYRLRPLSEVGAYIRVHRHLPDIPTEAEVREKGVSLGDMQAKLLAKVEELTLHMIQADERSDLLEKQNRELRERIAQLENRVAGPGGHAAGR